MAKDALKDIEVTRAFGDCNLCCKIPSVDNPEGFKPDMYSWCTHCDIGVGCKIYDRRPDPCKEFICHWLRGIIPEELKPNKVGFYITQVHENFFQDKVFSVYAEPFALKDITKHLDKINLIDTQGNLWRYVIRYNANKNEVAVYDKVNFGNKLKFYNLNTDKTIK